MTARRFLAAALATIAAGALVVAWHERQTSRWAAVTDTGSVAANLVTAACVVMALLFTAALVWPARFGLGA